MKVLRALVLMLGFELALGMLPWVVLAATIPHANCCLCMCHAKDETKCSMMCIRLQHGKKIVELPEMTACTNECKRVHVVTVK